MRARRSAKFAEYLSTYAILEHIGIHPTTLIEKRDTGVGMGVYVRDACDAGTALLAIPSKRFCATSVLSRVGLKMAFRDPWAAEAANTPAAAAAAPAAQEGLLAFLMGSPQWAELAWRLALEQHRSVSPLWGWLQSLPSVEAFTDQRESAERRCRVHHPMLLPYYRKGRQCIQAETEAAYAALRPVNVLPSFDRFLWAVDVLLSRSRLLPTAWPVPRCTTSGPSSNLGEATGEKVDDDASLDASLECGVVPFLDLVNGPDDIGRAVNADIEVATSLETLPRFLRDELVADAVARGRGDAALAELERVLETHYFLCLTLRQPLRAGEEVILDWPLPVVTTGVLDSGDDAVLSRLLKYMY